MTTLRTVSFGSALLGWALAGGMGVSGWAPDDAGPDLSTPFVNWESPHVHPLDLTPDGRTLLAVNTPDARLEVFDVLPGGALMHRGSVPVGLDPVSVRARTNGEAWVVNHISDSVSIVDLAVLNVRGTIDTADEPADVVFAAGRAFVSCSQADTVQVFSANAPSSPLANIPLLAEDPRSLAVSPDGRLVYVAAFESGNASTILNGGTGLAAPAIPRVVNNPAGPHGGVNPPFNNGNQFEPPVDPGNPPPLPVGLIVKRDAQGRWLDDTGADWTEFVSGPQAGASGRPVGWTLLDHDVAAIDAATLSVTYATGLMNICMALAVNPSSGAVTVVGTDALNEARYEPNLNGRFLRVNIASFRGTPPFGNKTIRDLNPHLTYSTSTVPRHVRDQSVGDPRAIAWQRDGRVGFVAGMGSNNVIAIDATGRRAPGVPPGPGLPAPVVQPPIEVGRGPTGLALAEDSGRLFVLNRFDNSISSVSLETRTEMGRVPFHDATPTAIKVGRSHLVDTRATSGLGHVSCASCHVDARFDRLAWDLGDPSKAVEVGGILDQNLGAGMPLLEPGSTPIPFEDWHEMKGPMTTQTLQDIIHHEPLHWRGDRAGIEEFNGAFTGLLGDDEPLDPVEMQQFENYLATITFPPNPFRTFENRLPLNLPLTGHFSTGRFSPAGQPLPSGNAFNGMGLYVNAQRRLCAGSFSCVQCHTLPSGAGTDHVWNAGLGRFLPFPTGPRGENHRALISIDAQTNVTMKIPQLRNMHEKTGMNFTKVENTSGFGYLHDGSIDSIERFIGLNAFSVQSDVEIANLVAFMLAFSGSDLPEGNEFTLNNPPGHFSRDTHAGVGTQVTIGDGAAPAPGQRQLVASMRSLADGSPRVGLIVKGIRDGEQRGWVYEGGGMFQSDRAHEQVSDHDLFLLARPGEELTWSVVAHGTQRRLGIDRDMDGWLDRDELDQCADPADPANYPGGPGNPHCDQSTGAGVLDIFDFLCFQNRFAAMDPVACDCDTSSGPGSCDIFDFLCFQNAYSACE